MICAGRSLGVLPFAEYNVTLVLLCFSGFYASTVARRQTDVRRSLTAQCNAVANRATVA